MTSILSLCKIEMKTHSIDRDFYGAWSLSEFYDCACEFWIAFARFEGLLSIVAGFIEVYDLLGGFGGDDSGLGIRFGFLDLAFGEG